MDPEDGSTRHSRRHCAAQRNNVFKHSAAVGGEGGIVYPWSNANVFGCLIGFGLLLIVFVCLQIRGKERLAHRIHTYAF